MQLGSTQAGIRNTTRTQEPAYVNATVVTGEIHPTCEKLPESGGGRGRWRDIQPWLQGGSARLGTSPCSSCSGLLGVPLRYGSGKGWWLRRGLAVLGKEPVRCTAVYFRALKGSRAVLRQARGGKGSGCCRFAAGERNKPVH